MIAWFRPEVLAAYGAMWAKNAQMNLLWYFDMVISFSLSFAFAYGLLSFSEKAFPPPFGRRPRVWTVLILFGAVVIGYPLFIDRFVASVTGSVISSVIMALVERFPGLPGEAVSQTIVDIAKILACVWAAGFTVMSFRTFRGLASLAKMAKRLPDSPDFPLVHTAFFAAGIRRAVAVKIGPPDLPIVSCGLLKGCIILPEDFTERYSLEEQYAILVHECIHIKNRDALKLLFLSLARTVLWFDPVAGHAIKRVKIEMELLCDWTSVNACRIQPSSYAALIVKAVSDRPLSAAGFSDTYRLITRRLSHILRDPDMQPPSRLSRPWAILMTAGLVSLLAAAAVLYANILPPPKDLPPPDFPMDDGMEIVRYAKRDGIFGQYGFVKTACKKP